MYYEFEETPIKSQKVLLQQNGDVNSPIVEHVYQQLQMSDLQRLAKNFKIEGKVRVFTQQGVELFEEDLAYLKDGVFLYLSDRRDFDQQSSFSIYTIEKTLGEGGFGQVFLGKHRVTGELVAIKIIDCKSRNAADIDLVFREAEVMKSLSHRNIVKIINCYTLPSMEVVLIMELLKGGELFDYVQQRGKLNEEEARVIFKQIAEAINYCHIQKLIHRDLKLENVLLTNKQDKQVKIIDFGIASSMSDFNLDEIDIGSLNYMAPEILSHQVKHLRPSIDVWAMGCILFALVTGSLPFYADSQNTVVANICNAQYTLPGYLSPSCKELIGLMLTRDPDHRIYSYQIIGHPWVRKESANILSPPVKSKNILFKTNTLIRREQTSLKMMNLKGGITSLQQPKLSIKVIETEPISAFPAPPLTEPTHNKQTHQIRKFDQKVVDRIFREDAIRERKSHISHNPHKSYTEPGFTQSVPTSKLSSPTAAQNFYRSNFVFSRNKSREKTLSVKSVALKTIVTLSHEMQLKQYYADSHYSIPKPKKKYLNSSNQLYKIQQQFCHRKQSSDKLFLKKFYNDPDKIGMRMFYSVILKK